MEDGGGWSSSLGVPLLISLGNTLTDTPRKNVSPGIWVSLCPVTSTHKINDHNGATEKWLGQNRRDGYLNVTPRSIWGKTSGGLQEWKRKPNWSLKWSPGLGSETTILSRKLRQKQKHNHLLSIYYLSGLWLSDPSFTIYEKIHCIILFINCIITFTCTIVFTSHNILTRENYPYFRNKDTEIQRVK